MEESPDVNMALKSLSDGKDSYNPDDHVEESPDVNMALESLSDGKDSYNPDDHIVRDTPEMIMDSFQVWLPKSSNVGGVFEYGTSVFVNEFPGWVQMCDGFVKMEHCDTHVVYHAVFLFLKYIHHQSDLCIDTKFQWRDLYWHRLACMWIALKFSDSDYDDLDLLHVSKEDKSLIKVSERHVMEGVNFELGAPADYMYLFGEILSVHPSVMATAHTLLLTFIERPYEWYHIHHATICGACIVASRGYLVHDDSTTVEEYAHRICELLDVNTVELLHLADLVLTL